jgi:hypothetical protein
MEAASNIPQNFIFDHPNINDLARAIHRLIYPDADVELAPSNLQLTRDMIAKYTADMPPARSRQRVTDQGAVVLLTGSTGNLGTHILAALLKDDSISRVFTFDRFVPDAQPISRLLSAFEDRGLPVDILSSAKLTSLTGSLHLPHFGLPQDVYGEVRSAKSSYYTLELTTGWFLSS